MAFSNGVPIPPAPGDWSHLPVWAREHDPYRGVPVLTTSKASSVAVRHHRPSHSVVSDAVHGNTEAKLCSEAVAAPHPTSTSVSS